MASVIFLLHLGKTYTVRNYIKSWGRELGPPIRIRNYPGLRPTGETSYKRLQQIHSSWRFGRLRDGELESKATRVVIFSDLDRLREEERSQAVALHQRLTQRVPRVRLLNHPRRSLGRFDLLRALYERGTNRFNIYRLNEQAVPKQWPVFLRRERGHGGVSSLLRSQEDLDREIERLNRQQWGLDDTVIIEHCDVADKQGIARKYGAFRVGNRIIARHIHFSRNWMIRFPDIKTQETTREELAYVQDNRFAQKLMEIFELARIDYGRIDFGVVDGQVQVWEINTNPMILVPEDARDPLRFRAHDAFARRFAEALVAAGEAAEV
jgi:hypothetical protein